MRKNSTGQEAIYARQSVYKEDSVSIEAQIEECKSKCDNPENAKVYFDKGYSGKNTERPSLKKMIDEIEKGNISKVIVYKLDRISRNIADFYKLYEIMQTNNCKFASKKDDFDTDTPMGRAVMGILAVFAQMERENAQIRVKDNLNYRIENGYWATGKAPFGFKNDRVNKIATLTPIQEEMDMVCWMFKTYATEPNTSLGQIQDELIKKGMTGHQSNKGFSKTTIGHILTNPIYACADELLYNYYVTKGLEFVNEKKRVGRYKSRRYCR